MASTTERDGQEDTGNDQQYSIVDSIKALAAYNARADLADEKQLRLFLESWWSRTYNRPLKDPLLKTYTVEELLYEFYDRIERRVAEEERNNLETDKIEDEKEKATLDWAEQEEKRELEALKAKAAEQTSAPTSDPTKDPANVAWMEEQLKKELEKGKELYGDSFGEDIEEEFHE